MAISNNARLGLGVLVAVAIGIAIVMLVPRPKMPEAIENVAQTVAAAPQETTEIAPRLDTLRVEPDGSSVLAGQATPLQEIAIVVDGIEIEVVTVDAAGSFVAFPMLGYADVPRTLTLIGDPNGSAIAADETYLIAPLVAPVQVAISPDTSAPSVAPVPLDEAPLTIMPADTPPTEPVAAPSVLVATSEGVRVVQPSGDIGTPEVLSSVALDSITYEPSGEVQIAGRATSGRFVQVYLDNQPITTSRIFENGSWQTELPEVDQGVYTLRVDEVNADGDVISRVETPFQREEPSQIAAQMAIQTDAPDFRVAVTTVQPGASLWAIAAERFGEGILYVKVFEANRDRIRDPDLIYPGQVFRIPEISE